MDLDLAFGSLLAGMRADSGETWAVRICFNLAFSSRRLSFSKRSRLFFVSSWSATSGRRLELEVTIPVAGLASNSGASLLEPLLPKPTTVAEWQRQGVWLDDGAARCWLSSACTFGRGPFSGCRLRSAGGAVSEDARSVDETSDSSKLLAS